MANKETHIHGCSGADKMNYADWIEKIDIASRIGRPGRGRSNVYLAFFNDNLVGMIYVRYEMHEDDRYQFGDIGYSVRPSARRVGFATEMLSMGLSDLKRHGLTEAILVCDKNNIASAKTITNNGGQLIFERESEYCDTDQIYIIGL
jgi:predicted acetyltransferase